MKQNIIYKTQSDALPLACKCGDEYWKTIREMQNDERQKNSYFNFKLGKPAYSLILGFDQPS